MGVGSRTRQVDEKFYGCGAPLPCGVAGLRVLDLGSGSGRDCYVMSKFVGENGSVVGVDMTEEQLAVARDHTAEYTAKLGCIPCRHCTATGDELQGQFKHCRVPTTRCLQTQTLQALTIHLTLQVRKAQHEVRARAHRVSGQGTGSALSFIMLHTRRYRKSGLSIAAGCL
jgi:SAM-dependent methyltransferase